MKKIFTLLVIALISANAWSYDFSVVNADGKEICYSITSTDDKTVVVITREAYEYVGNINIPSSVTYSGNTYTVEKIGIDAFVDCSGLTEITIPNSVTSIGNYAFKGCSGLTKIHSLSSTPSGCSYFSFDGVSGDIPVYVPKGSKTAYQSVKGWKDFTNIIETDFTGIEETAAATEVPQIKVISGSLYMDAIKAGEPINVYSTSGMLLYSGVSVEGVNIIPVTSKEVLIVKVGNAIQKVNM